jgi:Ankyrin repeats (3 copies)
MSYKQLIDLVTASPARPAARNALAILRMLAHFGDFQADLAIGTVLARELRLVDSDYVIDADSAEQLASRDDIPALARMRIFAACPRIVFSDPEAVRKISQKCCEDESLFQRFQWLVRHDSMIQDEALKAFLLAIIANMQDFGQELAQKPGGYAAVLRTIANSAKVTQGYNADTSFAFGRELILHRGIGVLMGAAGHEAGHLTMWSRRHPMMPAPSASDLNTLAAALPDLLDEARELLAEARDLEKDEPGSRRTPRLTLKSGIVVLCSMQQLGNRIATHVSFSLDGSPLDLDWAAQAALLALQVLGIDPQRSAVAYSNAGIFHAGSFDTPDFSSELADPEVIEAQLAGLSGNAATWIEEMKAARRLVYSEDQIWHRLLADVQPARAYVPYETSSKEVGICGNLRPGMDPSILLVGNISILIGLAVRCTDVEALRWILDTGYEPTEDEPNGDRAGLAHLGVNCGVILDGDRTLCYGATVEGALGIIAELHRAGFDMNEPVNEDGSTLLIEAAGRSADLVRFLLAHGADPHASDYAGRTALIEAAAMGNAEAVEVLLRSGSDPDAATDAGRRAIDYALEVWDTSSRVRIADALAEAGAEVEPEPREDLLS